MATEKAEQKRSRICRDAGNDPTLAPNHKDADAPSQGHLCYVLNLKNWSKKGSS